MTCRIENTQSETAVELIAERGLEGLSDALSLLINEAMRLERDRHLRAAPYERTSEQGYANGYKAKTLRSRMGGVCDGKRDIIGVPVALSEAEVHWRDLLSSLTGRGLHGIKLLVSDSHAGLTSARAAVFPSVPWQRCQFHLQQNAQAYVPRNALKRQVAADIRAIFDAPDESEAKRLIERFTDTYQKSAPKLADWAQTALPQGLAVLALPVYQRKRLRTSNAVEVVNKEIKRRTRVATLFPNEASYLRLLD